MTQSVPDPCDIPGLNQLSGCAAKDKIEDAVGSAADKVGTVIEFGKDPFGFIAQQEAEAAKDLTENVIPALTRLTQPDLSAEWFLDTYAISFAAAIFGWLLITVWDVATFRSRGESGQEVIDSLLKWTPIFIGGSMFGPAVGAFLVQGIGRLNTSLVDWGISASTDDVVTNIHEVIGDDPAKVVGGTFVAMLIFGALVLSLLLVFLVLIIMMVTLYLSGVVLPLSLMWATKIGQREKGRKVIMVWVGILCSQPLIFLLLGFAFTASSTQVMEVFEEGSVTSGPSLANTVQMLVVIVMLVIATLGPTTMAAYAPVGPTEGTPSGPGVNARGAGKSSGARGGAGPSSSSSSQTSQIAQQNAAKQSSTAASGTAAAGTAAGAAATGGTLVAAKAAKDGAEGLADKAGEMNTKGQETGQGTQKDTSSQGGQSDSGGSGQAGTSGAKGTGQDGSEGQQGGLAAKAGDSSNDGQGGGRGKDKGSAGGRLKGAGQKTAQVGGRAVGLAQQAGDFAEEQMDHHRDGARGRR